ncbi:MAG TPA: serine hydrolase domain-containing protein [Gemmatimonadaceae bacterium]|nr:serine hydrolase domain-containing protein [Gemmatimonadaceae bacterium]
MITARKSFVLLSLAALGSAPVAAQPTSVRPLTPSAPRQEQGAVPAVAPAATRGVRDRAELAAFLDGIMLANLRDKHVAGATIAVVKDGALFFAKGYGYSDVDKRTPVDAERTLFRIGSTSKLFTWTAVMQLVEQGKLDLNADVNRYLDFKIPDTYPQPITLRHILTHTPGFEEDGRDLISKDSSRLVPLGTWLSTHIPGRVRPPGTFSSYSNYATALAGYVVQRVSGVPFDDYVERNVLAPLGMTHTTTRQPLPASLRADMSGGYSWGGGHYAPEKFEIVLPSPAGSMAASAGDMATFMIAHLNNGSYNGKRILAESTATLMHSRAFGHDPRVPGFALGFYEKSSHGLRIIGHGGDTQYFHTDLALMPSEKLGVFVSYNTATGGELSFGPFLTQFLDHYYSTPATAVAGTPDATKDAERVAGEYEFNRRSYTTFQAALGLATSIRIAADSGRLVMASPLGASRFVPVGKLLYRDELGDNLLAFQADDKGNVVRGFLGMAPMMTLERLPFTRSLPLHWTLLGLGVLVFLAIVLAAIGRWVRRRWGEPRREDVLPGRWLLVTIALLELAFLAATGTIVGSSGGLLEGPLTSLKVALSLPVIATFCALGAAYVAVRHWRSGAGTRAARLRYSGAVVVALLFTWSLAQWNLLGWRM